VSVRKRGPRRWEVRWRDGDRHRSAQFSTRDEAKEFDEERRRRRRMGAFAPTDPSDQPLVEHAREWFDRERDGWAKSTRLNRAHLLDRWIIPYLGGERLKDVGQPRVRAWRAAIERDGAPTVSANRALGTLSAMLGAAVRDRKLPFNPCSGVDKRREVVSRPRVLTPLEVERIRAEMPSFRDATLVSLMAYAGLRPAEAFALRWGDVGNLLVVDRSFMYGELRPTKTGSRRVVDVVEPLREDLERLRVGAIRSPAALVAPTRQGTPLDLRTWRRRIWRPAVARAFGKYSDTVVSGQPPTPYDLRHSYCSLLAHEGRSAPYIAAMMGHALTDTQRHYAHMIKDARLALGTTMVDAIRAARASLDVREKYANVRYLDTRAMRAGADLQEVR
jgi:integrase